MKTGSVVVYRFTMDYFQGDRIEYFSRKGKHKKEALLQIRN